MGKAFKLMKEGGQKSSNVLKKWLRSSCFWLLITPFLLFLLLDVAIPFKVSPRYSTLIAASDGTILHAFLNDDDKWRLYTELEEITPVLRQTILQKEDRYFYYHPGFNPVALGRAFLKNTATGRRSSGASTITMQVVRLLEPRQRTYLSKAIELFRAVQLELHYSKDEILQLYLNLIPYGGNIEGMKSASLLYFGKLPQLLSLAEITTLTIIPNRPSSLRLGQKNAFIVQERNKWLRRFEKAALFDKQVIDDAVNEPLTAYRREAPKLAPHLAFRLKKEHQNTPIIRTTILPTRQAQVEQMTRNYVNRLQSMDIHNAAVIVVNNETMRVEAYVGSADFNNPYDGGQVDGIRAVRSPGSTLKPLLYAIAFDKGMITPKSAINDVSTNFGGFEPENFDRRFNGKVTIEFALANSLNIPAVKVLKELTPSVLIGYLKKSDFQTVKKQSKDLGLSMILGGCGVTLEELTRLFTSFANGGKIYGLNYSTDAKKSKGEVLVSPESAYLINGILTQITRPDLPNNFDNTYHLPRIAWKTGTSYGKKDAWSIGYNRRYTVGVWVGNFSGVGVPELNGANIATPLLFDVFNAIDYNSPTGWFKPTTDITRRKVCAESGDLPAEFCTHQVLDYAIMGISPTRRCQHSKWVLTDKNAEISYCTQCLPDSGYVRKLYPNMAPELIAYNELNHIPFQRIPPHNPKCTRVFEVGAPVITSPNDGSEYFLENQELQLACQASNDVREVYWYINDKLIQKANPQAALFVKPPVGKVKISCSDDKGRNVDVFIKVLSR
ncbi:penicillin-binding protein 1C [Runella salmonicolor]|uniref:peptidoglycan glycosyltransferase n=1 Tax=Runella salmonicolor TaxID=2950278 RepID=A0ABT1FPN3_9BACT|nr:penicillin-binding protein 1C [Runella salmonicolor]MCP1383724.1 penicillin-binding protein 1C [Runella salmonicolor]